MNGVLNSDLEQCTESGAPGAHPGLACAHIAQCRRPGPAVLQRTPGRVTAPALYRDRPNN